MNPSVMVLVQNEEYWLPYVLAQTKGYFDSYVIYDVGSTDQTRKVIEWWMDSHAKETVYRALPNVPPEVQGTFRNSMIAEGKQNIYLILDGDELYTKKSISKFRDAAIDLNHLNTINNNIRFGVIDRVEILADLKLRYVEQRTHHRLYSRDAIWGGTHPGEVSIYAQNSRSEKRYEGITCWHMHNTLRSSKEEDATKRLIRKAQKTYHPGTELMEVDLLRELPMLRAPIESFPVSPALEALQRAYNGN